MIEILHKIFPNTGMILFSLSWIVASMVVSTLFNNQDVQNKRLNMLKSFMYSCFAASWGMLASYYQTGKWSFAFPLFMAIIWGFYLVGDWISFLLHQLKFSPGGVQGWIWFGIVKLSKSLQTQASTRAIASLRPTERKLYEAEVNEKSAQILSSLVDSVPGAQVIVAPPPITTLLPNVKQLTITPVTMVSVVPETLVVKLKPEVTPTPPVTPPVVPA